MRLSLKMFVNINLNVYKIQLLHDQVTSYTSTFSNSTCKLIFMVLNPQ